MSGSVKNRIKTVEVAGLLEDSTKTLLMRDRDIALSDLKINSLFHPANDESGPYDLSLSVEENRLIFRIKNSIDKALPVLILSLKPYRRLIKDYFLIVDSYENAIRDGQPSRIEAIDMGRRGLHNEGAALLMERLSDKITLDMNTARRLFTLICVLHSANTQLWR